MGKARVSKSHPRISACGDLDELNCLLGAALAAIPSRPAFAFLRRSLPRIQGMIFELGARLATPQSRGHSRHLEAIMSLESEIGRMEEELPKLKGFILPGGSAPAIALHLARAVCRRAERSAAALGAQAPAGTTAYLNRLSDWLFVAARWANHGAGRKETLWKGAADGS